MNVRIVVSCASFATEARAPALLKQCVEACIDSCYVVTLAAHFTEVCLKHAGVQEVLGKEVKVGVDQRHISE